MEDLAEDEAAVRDVRVVASAVSAKRTVAVEVGDNGCVVGVRLLSDAVRRWDLQRTVMNVRCVVVRDVAIPPVAVLAGVLKGLLAHQKRLASVVAEHNEVADSPDARACPWLMPPD